MADVVVVGAGVGGLAASIHLAAAGHDVVVLERLDRAGGKLDGREAAGFRWETGPSLLTLPSVFEELAAVAGRSLDELVALRRLDPICRYRFADGTTFDHRADLDDAIAAAEALAPGGGAQWRAFMDHARDVWEVAARTFLPGPMERPLALLRRMQRPGDLLAIDPLRSLHDRAAATFTDPRLVQYADRYATYSGSSPYRAPATLCCIAHLEQSLGAWYVEGGLGRLADALAELAAGAGATLRLGADVEAVEHRGGRVTGVRLADGSVVSADAVVANVDALHLYRDLLPDPGRRRRTEWAPRSSSGYVLLLGVEGRTGGLAHHNVSFSADYEAEFDAVFSRGVPASDPTVYVCAASVTDPTTAPVGSDSWFVLVNAPAGAGALPAYGDHVLEVMAARGWDLAGRIVHREDISPADLEHRFRTPGGSIYGTSSNGRAAAFLRPGNRGPVDRLYLCGGSTHPGGGLPLVAMSGGIAARLCLDDLAGRRAR